MAIGFSQSFLASTMGLRIAAATPLWMVPTITSTSSLSMSLRTLLTPDARIGGVVLLDDRVRPARDRRPRLLGPEHEAGVGVLAEHREGLRERQQHPDLDGIGSARARAREQRGPEPPPPWS